MPQSEKSGKGVDKYKQLIKQKFSGLAAKQQVDDDVVDSMTKLIGHRSNKSLSPYSN